ncbi:hypothetical protein [Natrialba magadii]|nr:hypothetical protein [Natrialba magadii]
MGEPRASNAGTATMEANVFPHGLSGFRYASAITTIILAIDAS